MSVVSLKKKILSAPSSRPVLFWLLTKDIGAHSGKFKENHGNIKRYPTAFLLQVHCFFTLLSRTLPFALISVTHILFCKKGAKQTAKCKTTSKNNECVTKPEDRVRRRLTYQPYQVLHPRWRRNHHRRLLCNC